MIEKDVVVTTKHGAMPSFAVCPEGAGNFPAVILYMDAPGIREELRNIARRIAKHGYFCLLPDMYYRYGTLRFDLPRRDETMSAVIRAAYTNLSNAAVADDTAGMLSFLDGQDKVRAGVVGCVGYCMSGCFVTTVAARFADRFASAASLYGVGIVTDKEDSPHFLLDKVKGELYYGFAETDTAVPSHVIPTLKTALEKNAIRHELEIYPGTLHGYCFAERAQYHPAAAAATWDKLVALWDRTLK